MTRYARLKDLATHKNPDAGSACRQVPLTPPGESPNPDAPETRPSRAAKPRSGKPGPRGSRKEAKEIAERFNEAMTEDRYEEALDSYARLGHAPLSKDEHADVTSVAGPAARRAYVRINMPPQR